MTQVARIEAHLAGMRELQEIVGAMRSLAGMRVQEAQRALPGIRRYAQSLAAGIAAAQTLPSAARAVVAAGARALIVCAAEHGFVGGFNALVIDAAIAAREAGDRVFVLGSRGAALAHERGLEIAWQAPAATRLATAPDAVDRLVDALYAAIARGDITRVDVLFVPYRQGAPVRVERRRLLPLETDTLPRPALRQPPLHQLEPQQLLELLLPEYVFALLTEAAVEALTSENAARLAAMESARDHIAHKLAQLRTSAQQARQDEINSELLDLIIGAGALGEPA